MSDSLRSAEVEGNSSSVENEQSGLPNGVCPPDVPGFEATVVTIRPVIDGYNSLIALMNGRSLCAEKFRVLATRLRHIQERLELKTLAVTSGIPGDGKTFVASNLAITLASHSKQKVVLLEGDLRAPTIGHQFGLNGSGGLSEFLSDTALPEPIYAIEGLSLCVIPAGSRKENPMEVLQSARLPTLLKKLRAYFDWIVIDSPPLLPFADTGFWVRFADGVLLVVREARTQKKLLRKGLEALDNPTIVGVVLNGTHGIDHQYYDRYSSSQNGQR